MSHSNKALIASLLLLLACPLGNQKTIWVERGSTLSHLTFAVGHFPGKPEVIGVAVLSVSSCEPLMKNEVWHMDAI